jgi:hypothetical protein
MVKNYYSSDELIVLGKNYNYSFYYRDGRNVIMYNPIQASLELLKYKKRNEIPLLLVADLILFLGRINTTGIIIILILLLFVIIGQNDIFIILTVICIYAIYWINDYVFDIIKKLKDEN